MRFFIYILLLFALPTLAQSPYLDSLKLELNKQKSDTTRCHILNALIEAEYDESVWPGYNETLGAIAKKHLDNKSTPLTATDKFYLRQLSNHYNNTGYLLYNHQGDIQKAIEFYNMALKIDTEIDNKSGLAGNYNSLAVIYNHMGNRKKALDYYYKCLKLSEETNDKSNLAIVLTNIAKVQFDDGDVEEALANMHKSLKLREELGAQNGIANSLNNIATVYSKTKKFDKALEYYTRSMQIVEKSHDKIGIANVNWNIGNLFLKRSQVECDSADKACKTASLVKARDCFVKSLELHQESGNKHDEAEVLLSIGWIDFNFTKYEEAKRAALTTLRLAEELQFPSVQMKAASLLYEIAEQQKNWADAFKYHKQFTTLKDSIVNEENTKAAISEKLQYEYGKQAVADSIRMSDEKHIISAKLSEEKTKSYALYGGLAIVLLFAVFMFNRFKVTNKQKQIIEVKEKETQRQKELIEEKQKEIVDSINYAKRIQYTLLAHHDFLAENLDDHFVYFDPKDIVSGDFYWATKRSITEKGNERELFYLAVCDSTGHGVPGAFMSLLNTSFLNEAINERNILEPDKIFNYARQKLMLNISKEGQRDGFDGILLCIETKGGVKRITYAAANNNPVVIEKGTLHELPADKMPVGIGESNSDFKLYSIDAKAGSMLYLFTDGYADQFGGPKGKKFKYKQLYELMANNCNQPLASQQEVFKQSFNTWKGNLEQIDDVCIIGVRV